MNFSSRKTVLLCSVGISGLAVLAGLLIVRSSDSQADQLADRLNERLHELEASLTVSGANPTP